MSFFKGKSEPAAPVSRSIPVLYPEYYEDIQRRLVANGGPSETLEAVAFSIGNAIFNTAEQFVGRNANSARLFLTRFEERTPHDVHAADEMLDFVIESQPKAHAFYEDLLRNLSRVMATPA